MNDEDLLSVRHDSTLASCDRTYWEESVDLGVVLRHPYTERRDRNLRLSHELREAVILQPLRRCPVGPVVEGRIGPMTDVKRGAPDLSRAWCKCSRRVLAFSSSA